MGQNRAIARVRAQIEQRRTKVAANLLAGLNYRDISEALGVSIPTVCRDAQVIHERWRKEQVRAKDQIIQTELRRYDRALNGIWNLVLQGDLGAIEQFRKLSESKRKLLGLDAPTKSTVSIHAVDDLLELLSPAVREAVYRDLTRDPGSAPGAGEAGEVWDVEAVAEDDGDGAAGGDARRALDAGAAGGAPEEVGSPD